MSYISVRGCLGSPNTLVYGLSGDEKELLSRLLDRGPKTEDLNELSFFNPPMMVINRLEEEFGYVVIDSTSTLTGFKQIDMTMWTMMRQPQQQGAYNKERHEGESKRPLYLAVRGNLGCANTKVYGLTVNQKDQMSQVLRLTSSNDDKGEVIFYNAAMYAINQIEYHLDYVVQNSTKTQDQIVWTLVKIS